jgi:hypothetical protein
MRKQRISSSFIFSIVVLLSRNRPQISPNREIDAGRFGHHVAGDSHRHGEEIGRKLAFDDLARVNDFQPRYWWPRPIRS